MRIRIQYLSLKPTDVLHRMKSSGEQIDDRIVEVHWDPATSQWRQMRFRDDKPHGNYRTVVENIIQSIADGVEKDAVSHWMLSSYHLLTFKPAP